jgi:dienelactone hydrolase
VTASHISGARFLTLLLFCFAAGCASIEGLPDSYEPPGALPVGIAERFCYQQRPIVASINLSDEKGTYRVYEGSIDPDLDGYEDKSQITFEYYEQKDQAPAPVVMVLPILNGQKHVVRPFAAHFARNGYAVVIVDTVQRKTLLEDLINPEDAIQLTILRHRRVLDWIEARPGLDATRIAVFGASLGGFNALFLAAADPRVRAVAPALVGGDLPYVLTQSNERRIEAAVARTKESLSLDQQGMASYLEEHIQTDPISLAPYINANQVLMVMAKFDNAVPYESQLALRAALGNPQAITIPTGHITAAAYLFYLRRKVREFFDERLADDIVPEWTTSMAEHRCGEVASE